MHIVNTFGVSSCSSISSGSEVNFDIFHFNIDHSLNSTLRKKVKFVATNIGSKLNDVDGNNVPSCLLNGSCSEINDITSHWKTGSCSEVNDDTAHWNTDNSLNSNLNRKVNFVTTNISSELLEVEDNDVLSCSNVSSCSEVNVDILHLNTDNSLNSELSNRVSIIAINIRSDLTEVLNKDVPSCSIISSCSEINVDTSCWNIDNSLNSQLS